MVFREFLSNENLYFSVYFDFLRLFKDINYKGVPLAFVTFRVHQLVPYIKKINFEDYRITITKRNVQPYFEQLLKELIQSPSQKLVDGKILLYESHENYFNSKFEPLYIPSEYNDTSYSNETRKSINEIQTAIKRRFASLRSDPLLKRNPIVATSQIEEQFINSIPETITFIEHVLTCIKSPITCAVLGTTNGKFGRIVALLMKSKGIPSICTQHGIIGSLNGWVPIFTTIQAVYGEYEKQYYKQYGTPEHQLRITGLSRFDTIFTKKHLTRLEYCNLMNLPVTNKNISIGVYLTDVTFLENIIKILQSFPTNIILKPHPTEFRLKNVDKYKHLVEKYPRTRISENLYDTLANSDVVIASRSTSGLEALLFKKPVIFYLGNIFGGANYNYTKSTETNPIKIAHLVIQHLFKNQPLMSEQDIKSFLSSAYPVTNATAALSEVIKELTE